MFLFSLFYNNSFKPPPAQISVCLLKACVSADGTCAKTCKEGFYADMKQECEPCHHTCRSCGGPDYNDCDSCEDDMFLDGGQCISMSKIKCPDGKFLNGTKDSFQ